MNDLLPFAQIYLTIFLCASIALRVSTTQSADHEDQVVGTFGKTVKTLEEAIHGPDVRWRDFVEGHPGLAAVIFVVFLWITLVMLTMLTAMFLSRYDRLAEHVPEIFLYQRAQWTICQE